MRNPDAFMGWGTKMNRAVALLRRLVVPILVLAVLAALALSALSVVDSAQAATKPKNGLVAFSSKRGATRVVYTRQSNGLGLKRYPVVGRTDYPAFSPLGRRLAFTRYRPGGAQIWVGYADGTMQHQLTTGPLDTQAAWSPSGTALAFARGPKGGRDIFATLADGTRVTKLTRSRRNDEAPAWSARNRIAFVRKNAGSSDLYSVSALGGAAKKLTRSPEDDLAPAWSPTGKTLVYSKGRAGRRDLYVLTADGRHRRRLTAVKGDEGEPSFSPDGTRVIFTHTLRHKRRVFLMKVKGKPIRSLPRLSRRVRRVTTTRSASNAPVWQPTGFAPVIAAAGDIACDPDSPNFLGGVGRPGQCRQLYSFQQLLRMDLTQVLTIGDNQYEHGELDEFRRSFALSWGQLKPLIRPSPGNHEYEDPRGGAAGYFDYFNGVGQRFGVAGDRAAGGYYSYDIGTWHVISLNSECQTIPGGCGDNSTQVQWLRRDLAAHPATCTLAYFHGPLFTSGQFDDEAADVRPFWRALYAAGADVVLSGHEHVYERFAPQTPDGALDGPRGIREFTIGVGGRGPHEFVGTLPNSEVRLEGIVGALQMTLGQGSYSWRLFRAPTGAVADSGSNRCH
jgi:acid phosphatase type 7